MKKYYVYALLDTRKSGVFVYGDHHFTHEPYYIGLGKGRRHKEHLFPSYNKHYKYNPFKNSVTDKIRESGVEPESIKIVSGLTIDEAKVLEVTLIETIGRRSENTGPLTNLTSGGDGLASYSHSEDAKKRIGNAHRGENHYNYGGTLSDEVKQKISESLSGDKHPNFGRKWSAEVRTKMSEGAKNRNYTEDGLRKARESGTNTLKTLITKTIQKVADSGLPLSEETYKKNRHGCPPRFTRLNDFFTPEEIQNIYQSRLQK